MMKSQTFVLKMSFICMGMKSFAYQWLWNRGLRVATQKCRPINFFILVHVYEHNYRLILRTEQVVGHALTSSLYLDPENK